MKSLTLVLIWISLATCLFAQQAVVVTSAVEKEKTVSVNVNKTDNGERTVTITTEEDGDEKIIEWTDNGIIPEEIKKKLAAESIDISFLEGGDGDKIVIEVENEVEVEEPSMKGRRVMIKKNDNGEVEQMEWDGTGEMPEDIKKLLEEHDIDLDELHTEHGDHPRKKKMRISKEKRKQMGRKARADGRSVNKSQREQYKIITKDEDGNEKVIEWNGNGEMPKEMKELDGEINVFKFDDGGGHATRRMMFIADEDDAHLSDAYMGAQIESTDNGAKILDVMKDSPADKAGLRSGDIVQKVNGARAKNMDSLLGILTYFDPNDTVELDVIRDGKQKMIKMTLGTRPDSYR